MTIESKSRRLLLSGAKATGLLAAALFAFASAAGAGECPADKVVASGQGLKPGATAPKDVTDVVLGMIDVAKEPAMIEGRQFRLRRLEILPGGEVPWHSHEDRPALIYVVQGQITEYSSDCSVPIQHLTGDVSVETAGVSHWWKNNSRTATVLISADLLPVESDPHVM
ncbi:MAG TPA: cupin domain-containing protein [Geminicoccaceae bacterium]|nr:cupin domain-containing protein [Geminicoccaceae bacterium]